MWIKKKDYNELKQSEEFWRNEAARMNKRLIEQQLLEENLKTIEKTGDATLDSLMERMCRLEAKANVQNCPSFI